MNAHVNPIQVQKYLGGIDYPASKDDIINTARQQGADNSVIKTLKAMPGDSFNSPNDISEEIGKIE